jgi:hypothetical protein
MSAKAYVLLNVVHEKQQVVRALRGKPGVLMVDVVEGPPDVVVVLGARGRQRLAKLTIEALASVETMTEGLQLLPTRNRLNARRVSKTFRASRSKARESHLAEKRKRGCQDETDIV